MQFIILISLGLLLSACGESGDSSPVGNNGGTPITPTTGLSINTSTINFSATQNGELPATQFFTITWTGSNVADVVFDVPAGMTIPSWLNLSAPGTTTTSPVTLNVAVTATNLDPGNYSTTIRIIPNDINGNSLGLVDIQLTYLVNSTVTNITGLDFPSNPTSNMQSGPYVAFQWTNPQNIGLPAWGPLIPNTTRAQVLPIFGNTNLVSRPDITSRFGGLLMTGASTLPRYIMVRILILSVVAIPR